MNIGAQSLCMEGNNSRTPDEFFVRYRGNDNCRVLLRHSKGIAGYILINNSIPKNTYLQSLHPVNNFNQFLESKIMTFWVVSGLFDRRCG